MDRRELSSLETCFPRGERNAPLHTCTVARGPFQSDHMGDMAPMLPQPGDQAQPCGIVALQARGEKVLHPGVPPT